MTYTPISQEKINGKDQVKTHDEQVIELLQNILTELKISNIHLQAMSGEEIFEEDR